ncbi:MAG: protein kinase [Sandaracinaceae bacterium]|nr:protein kinase [Sandaracinaceae bacterium]
MTASPVRSFGKYLLDEEIARGGMSRVFLARLRGLGGFEKRLVVKQVLPELASDPRFVEMFVQEAKTLVQMSHPHIAPVYELGVVDGVYFLAMEHVSGATLSEILSSGPVAPELVGHLGAQICDALHYAHERFGIVHRDVTPRNVMVDEEGHARLLDFGIAAPASDDEGGALFGTPGYLSPEQADGEALGPASDVFSLGAVLFEALTARRAFFARTVEEAKEVLTLDGPDFYPDDLVPDTLARIIDHAMERDPKARYKSARELGRALRSWVAAHAPEGVGPELADRVRAASAHAPAEREDAPEDDAPRSGEVEVRTLATSRVLDEMLEEGTRPVERVSAPGSVRAADGEEPGTRPVERVSAPGSVRAADVEEEGTKPIERVSASPALPETDASPEGEVGTTRIERSSDPVAEAPSPSDELEPAPVAEPIAREREVAPPPSRRFELVALGLVAAGVLAWVAWPTPPEPLTPVDPPTVADDPPVDPPRQDPTPPVPPPDPPPVAVDPPVEDPPVVEDPPTPRPVAVARGTLEIASVQPAQAYVDGRLVGWTPVRGHAVRAGRHTLSLRSPHLSGEARRTFEVEPGETVRLSGDLETGQVVLPH